MADMMTFPDTVEEFMEQYKITDSDQVYTNGMEMVPIFRMKQWFEHQVRTQMSVPDCISRQAAIDMFNVAIQDVGVLDADDVEKVFELLPSAQPDVPDTNVGDMISRQAAIDAVTKSGDYFDMIERLNELPSAQPGWIPCSERLPEDVEIGEEYPTVIFCTAEGTVHVGGYEHYLGGKWWYMETWEDEAKGVIAWMPLPECYKGE